MEYKSFDELKNLWENDPEAAEEYHRAVVEDFIMGLPEEKQERARQLQWRIDRRVERIRHPQVRLEIVVGMMWESFFGLNDLLNGNAPIEELDTPPDNVLTSDKWGAK